MVCMGCRRAFDPDASAAGCAGCALVTAGCGKARCPHCGYENQRPLKDALSVWRRRFKELVHGPWQ